MNNKIIDKEYGLINVYRSEYRKPKYVAKVWYRIVKIRKRYKATLCINNQ